jgi:virginiamycin B lyase
VAVDSSHVYWSNQAHAIGRANLDGTGVDQSFITGRKIIPLGVAVNANHVYWANGSVGSGGPSRPLSTIGRANLDGTGVTHRFIRGATYPFGVAVDANHVYWADFLTGTIGRANLDGTGVNRSFITGATNPVGVAVDAG